MLLTGGEFNDGASITVFNEMFRWSVDRNEWRLIESINAPPPRSSHQTVLFREKVYLFGGEFATLDSFYHYKVNLPKIDAVDILYIYSIY